MVERYAVIHQDFPQIAAEPDGHIWDVAYDGASACDVRGDAHGYSVVCRLPANHEGKHMWFSPELIAEQGVRLLDSSKESPCPE